MARVAMSASPLVRRLYGAAGLASVGLAILGAILPGLPTTVFLIIALWCFRRSSPKLEEWLLSHRVFGPLLTDWDLYRSLSRRAKLAAIATIWIVIGLTCVIAVRNPWLGAGLVAIAVCVSAYLATRPNTEDVIASLEAKKDDVSGQGCNPDLVTAR